MAIPPTTPPLPLLAQRYQLERSLAHGGMAEVWLATDLQLTRHVAVKLLKPSLAADAVIAERFRREAIAAAKLTHPNIVAIYDTVDEGGRQAVVMQYVPGRSLREILDDERKLSVEMTIRIGQATAAALDAAHQSGLVHRDVKPGNILVTPENRVLLTDFGIAKALSESEPNGDLTSDNVMMGTAKYLSPEQVRGRRLDGRADLYALGLVLYECLAGRVPFREDTDAATALARLQRDPTPLGRLRPTLPRGLIDLIHRLLARNPDDRPSNGAAVQATLARILAQGDDTTPTGRTPLHGITPPRGTTPPRGSLPPHVPGDVRAASTGRDPSLGRTPSGLRTAASAGNTGRVSAVRTPPSAVRPTVPAHRDPTPSAGLNIRSNPNRQFQQRWSPSLVVVGGLLLAALIVGVLLWNGLTDETSPTTTIAPIDSAAAPAPAPAPTAAPGPASINTAGIIAYDPFGDDPTENNDSVSNLVDGSTGTTWNTVCYLDKYMGGKDGVGVVIPLTGPDIGQFDVIFGDAPWAAKLFVADTIPAALDGWQQVDRQFSETELNATFDIGPTRHQFALIWFEQLAEGEPCENNPFRGSIAEVTFRTAS